MNRTKGKSYYFFIKIAFEAHRILRNTLEFVRGLAVLLNQVIMIIFKFNEYTTQNFIVNMEEKK